MRQASRGDTSKNPASKRLRPGRKPPRVVGTFPGAMSSGSYSSRIQGRSAGASDTPSRPVTSSSQKASTDAAPGNRPLIPTMAIAASYSAGMAGASNRFERKSGPLIVHTARRGCATVAVPGDGVEVSGAQLVITHAEPFVGGQRQDAELAVVDAAVHVVDGLRGLLEGIGRG